MKFLSLLICILFTGATSVVSAQDTTPTLFLSIDAGETWSDFTDGLPDDVQPRTITEHNGDLYLITSNAGIFVMPEKDCAWTSRSTGLPVNGQYFHPMSMVSCGSRLILGTFGDGIWISDNGGLLWRQVKGKVPEVPANFYYDESRLLCGSHSGVWQSFDAGESWEQRADFRDRINGIAVHNNEVVIVRQNGMGVIRGDEITWSKSTSDWALIQLITQGEYVYATNAKQEIFRSKDGLNWETPLFAVPGLKANNVPEALWHGYTPTPAGETQVSAIMTISRGWVVTTSTGC